MVGGRETIMDVYEAVRSRRAVRGFKDEPVSREVLDRVLSAAAWSPSGSNIQPWNIYVMSLGGRLILSPPDELIKRGAARTSVHAERTGSVSQSPSQFCHSEYKRSMTLKQIGQS